MELTFGQTVILTQIALIVLQPSVTGELALKELHQHATISQVKQAQMMLLQSLIYFSKVINVEIHQEYVDSITTKRKMKLNCSSTRKQNMFLQIIFVLIIFRITRRLSRDTLCKFINQKKKRIQETLYMNPMFLCFLNVCMSMERERNLLSHMTNIPINTSIIKQKTDIFPVNF